MRPFVPPLRRVVMSVAMVGALTVVIPRAGAGLIVSPQSPSGALQPTVGEQPVPFFSGSELRWREDGGKTLSKINLGDSVLSSPSGGNITASNQPANQQFRDDRISGPASIDGVQIPAVISEPVANQPPVPNLDPVVGLPPANRGNATAIPLLPAAWSGAIGMAAIGLANGVRKVRRILR